MHGACNWRRGFGPARFPGGAVLGGAVPGTARGRERGMSKNSLLAWMAWAGVRGRYWGRYWGCGAGVRGTGPEERRLGVRRRGAGDCLAGAGEAVDAGAGVSGGGLWKTGPGGTAPGCGERGRRNDVWECGAGVRGMGPRRTASGRNSGRSKCGFGFSRIVSTGFQYREASAETWYPSTDAGKLKRDKATRKQGMQGVGATKRGAGEMLRESRLKS